MRTGLFFVVVLLLVAPRLQAQPLGKPYPDFNRTYSEAALQAYKVYYTARNDSAGLAYTYANLSKTQGKDYGIELDKFKNLLRYTPAVKRRSQNDYYQFMLLLIQYYYISQDFHSVQRSLTICDSIIAYGVRTNKKNLQFGAYLFKINFLLSDPKNRLLVYTYIKRTKQIAASKIQQAYYYYMLAAYLTHEKRYDEAIQSYQNGYAINPKIGSINNQEFNFLFLSRVYRLKEDYTNAIMFSRKELDLLTKPSGNLSLDPITQAELRRWANQELALVYHERGDYKKADAHWVNHNVEIDKISALKRTYGDFSDLQTDIIERELKLENENYKLNQQMARETDRRKTIQLVAFTVIFGLLILLILVLFFYYKQQIKALTNQRKIALLEGQELEREEIARELHDHVGSMLAGIKVHIPTSASNYQQLIGWVDEVYYSVRTLSHSLHTGVLHEEGLPQACYDFIDLVDPQHKITVQVHGSVPPIPPFTNTMAFRIIQELLTNALHHANARTIQLTLLFAESKLLISVEDDGIGFDTTASFAGLGLRSVKNRVETLRGQLEFDQSGKAGSTVLITLPLPF